MTEDLPLFKKQGQIRQPKQYSKREELTVVLSVLADFCHNMLDQIESLQTELSGVKDRVKDFENLHAENENLRDKLTGWLQKPDDCSEDCCSIADSLEHDYSDKRHRSS